MINSRLVFEKIDKDQENFSKVIERIDNFLSEGIYMESVSDNFMIYGSLDEKEVKVGREVSGREENLYQHETIKIQDFEINQSEVLKVRTENWSECISQIESSLKQTEFKNYRIEVKLDNLEFVEVIFF